jgi:putative two-component system response regulator
MNAQGFNMNGEHGATILIIDDAADNLLILSELLRPHYRVLAANSGEVGLRVAFSLPHPDLILLDVMMPVMDGFAVLARLREAPATRDIPVMFLTALSDAADEERGLRRGANDYITKPLQPAVVLARVRTQLEAKQARDWLRDTISRPAGRRWALASIWPTPCAAGWCRAGSRMRRGRCARARASFRV